MTRSTVLVLAFTVISVVSHLLAAQNDANGLTKELMARRVTLGFLIAAAAFLALTHGADVAAFVTTARGGSVSWLAVAAVLQVGYYLGYVLTYRQAFASVGIHRRVSELTPVMLASVFVNTVTPSAGTAGPALMIDDATRRGTRPGTSTAAVVIGQFADFAGFAVVMAAGFTYLAVLGRLTVARGRRRGRCSWRSSRPSAPRWCWRWSGRVRSSRAFLCARARASRTRRGLQTTGDRARGLRACPPSSPRRFSAQRAKAGCGGLGVAGRCRRAHAGSRLLRRRGLGLRVASDRPADRRLCGGNRGVAHVDRAPGRRGRRGQRRAPARLVRGASGHRRGDLAHLPRADVLASLPGRLRPASASQHVPG